MPNLSDTVREALRISDGSMMELEVDALISAAKADMQRIGVPWYMLDDEVTDPLVRMAIILFCKARFGYDNSEAAQFQASYRQTVKDILNSPTTYAPAFPDCGGERREQVE